MNAFTPSWKWNVTFFVLVMIIIIGLVLGLIFVNDNMVKKVNNLTSELEISTNETNEQFANHEKSASSLFSAYNIVTEYDPQSIYITNNNTTTDLNVTSISLWCCTCSKPSITVGPTTIKPFETLTITKPEDDDKPWFIMNIMTEDNPNEWLGTTITLDENHNIASLGISEYRGMTKGFVFQLGETTSTYASSSQSIPWQTI